MQRAVNEAADDGAAAGSTPGTRTAVDKALDVLTALVRPDGPHRLSDIARHTGLAKATVHRTLHTLGESGYAAAVPGGYDVGPRLLGMASAALAASRESRFARPLLHDLQQRTGHTAHYAVRHGDRAVYVDTVDPDRGYRMSTRAGGEVPLHCTGMGRAILSRAGAADVAAALAAPPGDPAPHLPTDPAELRRALATAAEQGFAVESERYEPHVRSVAAPVLDATGRPVGAIGVAGLTFTLGADTAELYGPIVRDAAARLTEALGRPAALRLSEGGRA
ncbi:IclR family transcriptional regulator [Murinocardiopsis flavida]|nr:IclR family transcriptional regulator [Murinocardiopsis flavida]